MVYIAVPVRLALRPGHGRRAAPRRGHHRRRVRGHLQGVLADDGRGDPDHHRLLDERHDRRLRPHPRERGAAARRRFDRVVNQSINETLSRTILTSATVFFVTLAMNVLGVGVIRDFAFAMNVGVIVGTYSSIFIASPILIWLNEKYSASQSRQQGRQAAPSGAAVTKSPKACK